MKTIFIGLPAFGGLNYTGLTQSLLKLQRYMLACDVAIDLHTVANCASQPAGRGYPITQFIDHSDADYYLSLDADMEFEPDQIARLLDSPWDMCAATYGTKREPSRLVINYVERPAKVEAGFVEAKDVGLGCVLATRAAIVRLHEAFPRRVLHNGHWIVTWFFPRCDGQDYVSCDAAFWWHWRQLGGRVWVDLASDITHWGTHRFYAAFPRDTDATPRELIEQQWAINVGTPS